MCALKMKTMGSNRRVRHWFLNWKQFCLISLVVFCFVEGPKYQKYYEWLSYRHSGSLYQVKGLNYCPFQTRTTSTNLVVLFGSQCSQVQQYASLKPQNTRLLRKRRCHCVADLLFYRFGCSCFVMFKLLVLLNPKK